MNKAKLLSMLMGLLFYAVNGIATPEEDIIVIDDVRNLQVSDNTRLTIDRRQMTQNRALEQFGTGFWSRTASGFRASMNFTSDSSTNNSGELTDINLFNSVIGPVTSNDNSGIEILFVELVIDGNTIIEGIENINELNPGDIVAASGIENDDGKVKVTRLEYFPEGSPYWLIMGDISNLSNNDLNIGQQHINLVNEPENMTIILCENEVLENDLKVIIDLFPNNNYLSGESLDAQAVICFEEFDPSNDPPNGVFFNGDIEQINHDQTEMIVNGLTVIVTSDTEIISANGTTQLEAGMNVSIDGYEDEDSDNVIATFIIVNEDGNPLPPDVFLFFGEASNVTPGNFMVDFQPISRGGNTVYHNGDAGDLQEGSFIEVIAQIDDPNSNNLQFVALEITFLDEEPPYGEYVQLDGEVTSLSPDHLQFVLENESVEISDSTFIMGTTIDELDNNMTVYVEGFRNRDTSVVEATFLYAESQDPTDPIGHVCISGVIVSVNNDNSQFTLDNGGVINVTLETEFLGGSQSDLVVGTFVDIGGIVNDSNSEIEAEVVIFDENNPDSYVFFNGFITAVAQDLSQITVDDLIVNITESTQIFGGSIDNLIAGIEVQVDGLYNSNTDEIDAEFISLPYTSVGASAPVRPEDLTLSVGNASDGVINIMGIEVHQNELTWDASDVFTNGIVSEQSVVFFGYQDNEGTVWASVIFSSESNTPNGNNFYGLFVQGKIQSLANNELNILDVTIGNLENAHFLDEYTQEISREEFFNTASIGNMISVSEALSYDRENNTLNAGVISLEYNHQPSSSQNRSAGGLVSGTGIVTRVIEDVIYKNSF